MLRFISAIIALLTGRKFPTKKDNPTGIYRIPGELENNPEPTPIVKKENKKLKALMEKLRKMSYKDFLSNVWDTLFGIGVVGVIGGILFLIGNAVFSKGNVDYCYIERWTYVKEITPGATKPPGIPDIPKEKEDPAQKIPGKEQTVVIVYELKGHRNWREDRSIGRFDSLEAAIDGSHKINCAVEAK